MPVLQAQETVVTVNGVSLWTCQAGNTDGPTIVLCQSAPGFGDQLGSLVGLLSPHAHIIRYEQRGSGRSSHAEPYDLLTCLIDLAALLDALQLEQCIIAGHGIGADIALAFAALHPNRICGYIGISGSGLDMQWKLDYPKEVQQKLGITGWQELQKLYQQQRQHEDDEVTLAIARHLRPCQCHDAKYVDHIPLPAQGVNTRALRDITQDWEQLIASRSLVVPVSKLYAPALLIAGYSDNRGHSSSKRLLALLPNAHLISIEAAGYWPWIEQHEEVRSCCLTFFNQHCNH